MQAERSSLLPEKACSSALPSVLRKTNASSPLPEKDVPQATPPSTSGGKAIGKFGITSDLSLSPDMKEFIESFRSRRVALGYTQEDVGVELSQTNGPSYSQSFISRFESNNLGLKIAERMKPVMEAWLEQKEHHNSKGFLAGNRRKRRTCFSSEVLRVLISHFDRNPKPSSADIVQIAKEVHLEPITIRVWFCNRKQMLKRIASGKIRVSNPFTSDLGTKLKVQSTRKDTKVDFTRMPIGKFSFTGDIVNPLVCIASEKSPAKKQRTR